MKKRQVIILLSVMLFLSGCSNQRSNEESAIISDTFVVNETTQSYTDESTVQDENKQGILAEDSDMIETLRKLVDGNYSCITKLFYYGYLPFDNTETIDQREVAKVNSSEFTSISDIRDFLSAIYVDNVVEELLNNYFEGGPLYFEYNGELYEYIDAISFAGLASPWDSYEIRIIEQNDSRCIFEAEVRYTKDELRVGPDTATYQFTAIKENSWKLEGVVQKAET